MSYSNLDLNILKVLLTHKRNAIEFSTECNTNIFEPDLWNFANLVVNYTKVYKEIPTQRVIVEKLAQGKNDKVIEYVNNIFKILEDHSYNDKEYKFDLDKIKKRYQQKQISLLNDSLSKIDFEKADINQTISNIQKTVSNVKSINQTKAYDRKTLKDALPEFKEEFNAKLKDPKFDRGILTGYSALDSVTDGLREGELLLIGGESGAGKSMFLMNMAIQMWMQQNTLDMVSNFTEGCNVLYFSLEMPFKPCRNRVLSRLSGVNSKLIRNPVGKEGQLRLSVDDRNKLKKTMQFIHNFPYEFEIIDIPRGCSAERIEILFEEAKLKFNPQIIVVDYLGIMDDEDSKEDDWLKLGTIAGKLHELVRAHNLIGLSAVQLNRVKPSKDAEERVGMHRIGRSALIMHHANIGIQIGTRPNEKSYPDMEYFIIKCRDGGQTKGKLIKNLSCASLLDDPGPGDEDTGFEFTDYDDISAKIEDMDI
jgi:replicative DNA helicase